MKTIYILAIFIALSFVAPANAESYYERLIQQKQAAAEAKRQQALQNVQARQADPDGYMRAKYVSPTDSGSGVESFKVAGDGHYYVPVSINNKSVNFMADTGATSIFISQSDAKKVGINPQTLQYNQGYTTANGAKGRAALATARTLKVGSIQMTNVPVVVSMEQSHMALLGMEFFGRLKRYEVADGEMNLYK